MLILYLLICPTNYTVSALKYRPNRVGIPLLVKKILQLLLEQAIDSNQLAQAYLFCGPRGVGKTSTARFLQNLLI